MDPQKNDAPQGTPTEGENTPTNEINVDLNSLQNPTGAAPAADAATDEQTNMAVGAPAVESAVSPADPVDSSVSFTTDSDGTVQAVPSPDGISTPPLGSEGAEPPAGQQPGASVSPEDAQQGPDAFAAPTPTADPAAPMNPEAQVPFGGAQPSQVDPTADPASLPGVAPVPVPGKDKKMLVVLSVVAVVLIAAIAAMLVL